MVSGHLLHSALTCPPSRNGRRLKSRHSFVPAAQQLFSSPDNKNRNAGLWADHRWNAEWLENTTTLCISCPTSAPILLELPFQEQHGFGLITSTQASNVSGPAYTNGVWPPLQPVSVVQKNKPSTMLSFNVQSINLPMDCTA